MQTTIDLGRVNQRSRTAARARDGVDKHLYFACVADTRFILRKVFRMIDEKAKDAGLEPLAYQALLQIYGSPQQRLRVNALAERLDIVPAFASNLLKGLTHAKLIRRASDPDDGRASVLHITATGRALCHRIDDDVRPLIARFTRALSLDHRETVLSVLISYIGPGRTDGKTRPRQPRR